MLTLAKKTTEVYDAKDKVVHVGQAELEFLSQAITESPRRRARICATVRRRSRSMRCLSFTAV